MNDNSKHIINIALAYCGPGFVIGYIVFWGLLGHNVPPVNFTALSPDQLIAQYYAKYPGIPVAMIASAFFGGLYLPWSCLLSSLLREKDGSMGALSLMELTGGALSALLLVLGPVFWAACALLYTQVEPGTIKLIHAISWFMYDCTYIVTTIQLVGVGLYTILNKEQTIFPAWTGWCAIAGGTMLLPLSLMPFAVEGPFAVSGLWNFFIAFGGWLFGFFAIYSFYILKHVHNPRKSVGAFNYSAAS